MFLFIIIIQHISKGFIFGGGADGLIGKPIEFLFQSYGSVTNGNLNAQQIQVYKTVAITPWALKSIFGMLTDTIYIGGYNKIPYIFVVMLISSLSCITLAASWPVDPVVATCLLFFIFLYISVSDLLTEAKYSEKITQNPEKGPDIITFVWVGIFLGQILSTVIVGFLIDIIAPNIIYYIPALPIILMLYPVYKNWMGDKMHINKTNEEPDTYLCKLPESRRDTIGSESDSNIEYISNVFGSIGWFYYTSDDNDEDNVYSGNGTVLHKDIRNNEEDEDSKYISSNDDIIIKIEQEEQEEKIVTPLIGINTNKIKREWKAFSLCLLVGIISITTSIMAICKVDTTYLTIVSLLGAISMIIGFNLLIEKTTARIQTFIIIQNMFGLSISGATFFFFTDTIEQYPDGPHFSKKFYIIVMGVVGSVCSIIGAFSYLAFMKRWKYRTVFVVNNIIYIMVGLLNVVFFKRWNLYMGIPDTVFVLGAETFQVIIGQWTNMPVTTMMSQLCPRGMESTMFALLAGSSNLGNSLAQYQGAWLLKLLNIKPSGMIDESAQFDNLWIASLIATLLPLVTIFFIPCLIPDKYQTEDLIDNDNSITIGEHDINYINEYELDHNINTASSSSYVNTNTKKYVYYDDDDDDDDIYNISSDEIKHIDNIIDNTTCSSLSDDDY